MHANDFKRGKKDSRILNGAILPFKDENGKKISRAEPHHFLHLTQANSYFWTKYGILNSNLKFGTPNSKSDRIRFRLCSTDFYFSTFNSEYPEFEIRFKLNLAHYKSNLRKIISFSYDLG